MAVFTDDINTEVYNILEKYSAADLSLMISGGSLLVHLNDKRYKGLDTSKWEIFYSDERIDQSMLNYTASLPFIDMTKAKIYRICTSMPIQEAVKNYSMKLKDIDVCLLGIGSDGHICSLLPNSKELDAEENVIALEGNFPISPKRITVTLKFINEKVSDLYFVVPNSTEKNVFNPDSSITSRIKKNFTTILGFP